MLHRPQTRVKYSIYAIVSRFNSGLAPASGTDTLSIPLPITGPSLTCTSVGLSKPIPISPPASGRAGLAIRSSWPGARHRRATRPVPREASTGSLDRLPAPEAALKRKRPEPKASRARGSAGSGSGWFRRRGSFSLTWGENAYRMMTALVMVHRLRFLVTATILGRTVPTIRANNTRISLIFREDRVTINVHPCRRQRQNNAY